MLPVSINRACNPVLLSSSYSPCFAQDCIRFSQLMHAPFFGVCPDILHHFVNDFIKFSKLYSDSYCFSSHNSSRLSSMARMLAGLADAACDWVAVDAALAPLARSSSRKRSSSWSVLIVCRLELSWPITVLAIDILNFCSLQDKTRPAVEDSARYKQLK